MQRASESATSPVAGRGGVTRRALHPAIGFEILGVDLREPLSDDDFASIRQAWHDGGIILLRDQTLDEETQARFAARFGELGKVLHQHNGRSSLPGVMYISNIRENGQLIGALPDGEMYFHSDQCYIERPSDATMLYSMEVPSKGGDTLFANMYAAYDTLPEATKARIDGQSALNVYDYQNAATVRGSEPREGVPSWAHPMARVHPATGRKALYVNRLMTHHVVGLPQDESDALLDELFAHQEQERFVYRHVWKPGELLMWDNRCTLHARSDFDASERRLMRRVVVVREHA